MLTKIEIEQIAASCALAVRSSMDEVLTVERTADYLGLTRETVTDLARKGLLPAYKNGNRWFFSRNEVNDYILTR